MPDVYTTITEADGDTLARIAGILEQRAADPRQQTMRDDYLGRLALPAGATVVEVGCGTGAVARAIAARPGIGRLIGIDPSPRFIARARDLAGDHPRLGFQVADAYDLPLPSGSADAVVFHTVLSHLTDPGLALAEARRVLRLEGWLAIFDGDYASLSFARSANDPLEAVARSAIAEVARDPHLVRRLPALVRQVGFTIVGTSSYVFTSGGDDAYLLSLVERGVAALNRDGVAGPTLAEALVNEARLRSVSGDFAGRLIYGACIARRRDLP